MDLYLYDIREDVRRRAVGVVEARSSDGTVTNRRDPLRHFKLAYLVTAWTQRPEDEHRLLSALLACCLRYDAVPASYLVGSLAESGLPLGMTVASPPPENRQVSEIWSALGGELKASLDLVVTVHVDPQRVTVPAPPVLEPLRVKVSDEDGRLDQRRGHLAARLDPGADGGPTPNGDQPATARAASAQVTRAQADAPGAQAAGAPVAGPAKGIRRRRGSSPRTAD